MAYSQHTYDRINYEMCVLSYLQNLLPELVEPIIRNVTVVCHR